MTFDDWIKDNAPVGVAYNLADMRRGWEGCAAHSMYSPAFVRYYKELIATQEQQIEKLNRQLGEMTQATAQLEKQQQRADHFEQRFKNQGAVLDAYKCRQEELEAKIEELTGLKLREFVEAHQQFLRGALPNLGPPGGLWRATDYGALGGSGSTEVVKDLNGKAIGVRTERGCVKEIPAGYTIPVCNTIRSDDAGSGSIPDAPGDGASGNEYSATYGKQLRKIRSND